MTTILKFQSTDFEYSNNMKNAWVVQCNYVDLIRLICWFTKCTGPHRSELSSHSHGASVSNPMPIASCVRRVFFGSSLADQHTQLLVFFFQSAPPLLHTRTIFMVHSRVTTWLSCTMYGLSKRFWQGRRAWASLTSDSPCQLLKFVRVRVRVRAYMQKPHRVG